MGPDIPVSLISSTILPLIEIWAGVGTDLEGGKFPSLRISIEQEFVILIHLCGPCISLSGLVDRSQLQPGLVIARDMHQPSPHPPGCGLASGEEGALVVETGS